MMRKIWDKKLTGINCICVGVHRLGLLFLRKIFFFVLWYLCPSLRRRAGARLKIDRTSAIRSRALGCWRALQSTASLVDGRRDAGNRIQLRIRIRGLQGESIFWVWILWRSRRRWTVAALKSAPTVVDFVLDESDDLAEGVGRPAPPTLDGVWGRGTLRGFRCNKQRVLL